MLNIINKPDLTEEQKNKFRGELEKIITKSSEEVQTAWNNNKSILWVMNMPIIESNVQFRFKGKQGSDYVTLKNKLDNREI